MSYCRHNGEDSEVYVIGSTSGYLECLGCRITGEPASNGLRYGYFKTKSRLAMLNHLTEHLECGWRVPERAFERLEQEICEVGDIFP